MKLGLAIVAVMAAHARATPPVCSKGDRTIDAGEHDATAVRFCLRDDDGERTCWSFDAKTGRKLAPTDPLPSASLDHAMAIGTDEPRPAWTTRIEDSKAFACGPHGCTQFASDASRAAASASGARVAALSEERGVPTKQQLDLYDRASGKRIATITPRTGNDGEACMYLDGFAGETAILDERPDCTSRGGDRLLVSPRGKVVRVGGSFWEPGFGRIAHVGGDLWVFGSSSSGDVEVWDVARQRRVAQRAFPQHVITSGGHDRVYAFVEDKAIVMNARLETLATVQPPRCK